MKFRKKPVVIEAMEWTGDNLREITDFTGLHRSAHKWSWDEYKQIVEKGGLKIFTLEGSMMASIGDWIIRGVKGEFYPCKPDIFKQTYEQVEEPVEPKPRTFRVKSAEQIIKWLKANGYKFINGDWDHDIYPSFVECAFDYCGKEIPSCHSECYAWLPEWLDPPKKKLVPYIENPGKLMEKLKSKGAWEIEEMGIGWKEKEDGK